MALCATAAKGTLSPIAAQIGRLGVRYSQSLLSGRRSTGLSAKEPIQEPTQADIRRHRATPGDSRNVTGGQGVAGSNPAAPTQVRRLIRNSESAFWAFWDQDRPCGHV